MIRWNFQTLVQLGERWGFTVIGMEENVQRGDELFERETGTEILTDLVFGDLLDKSGNSHQITPLA